MNTEERQIVFQSKIGPIYISGHAEGLTNVSWQPLPLPFQEKQEQITERERILKEASRQIEQYIDGKLKSFELPILLKGTPFQKRVWSALMRIPFGQTASYSGIAHTIGHPNAVRAVGTANGRNQIAIIIPCHRVIAKSGAIGGYSAGIEKKKILLALEGIPFTPPKSRPKGRH